MQAALLSAFPTRPSLAQMVAFGLDQNLPAIAEGANLTEAVALLLAWAEAHGRLAALVQAALAANPTNPALLAVAPRCDWAALDAFDPWSAPVACPYPGMIAFSAAEAHAFFGRNDEVATLLQRLRVQRLLLVVGPSGSGKSSLVSAGALPQLATSSFWPAGFWRVLRLRPGSAPLVRLEAALAEELPLSVTSNTPASELHSQQALLVVDQFEELFTQASLPDQQAFLQRLQALEANPQYVVLLVMRADFYPELMNTILWPIDFSQRIEVAPLRGEALRSAIEQPAAAVGVALEPALLERLLADSAQAPGVLPLLQETLVLLWNQLERRHLSLAAYERLSRDGRTGLQVALATRADATLAALSRPQQVLAQRVLLRLVQFGEGRPDTRRQQPLAALASAGDDPALVSDTIRRLADARLLTLSGEEAREPRVDLAHEALIGGWPQLQQWVQTQRGAEQGRRQLLAQATEWRRLGSGSGGLLDRQELAEAEVWRASATLGVEPDILALLEASHRAIRQSAAEILAIWQRDAAAHAVSLFDKNTQLSLAIALQSVGIAWRSHSAVEAQAENTLLLLLLRSTALRAFFGTETTSWSPDGKYIATRTKGRQIVVWDVDQYREHLSLDAQDPIWSPDGKLIAVNNLNNDVETRDTSAGTIVTKMRGRMPMWGPDGREIRSFTAEGLVIQEVANGQVRATIAPAFFSVRQAAQSSDGRYVAAADSSGAVLIYDTIASTVQLQPDTHTSPIRAMAWSPDGRRLATGGEDWTVRIWEMGKSRVSVVLLGHVAAVLSVAWSPDGRWIASASNDRSARIWSPTTGEERGILLGHEAGVRSVAWSLDSNYVATASADTTIKLWDATNAREQLTIRVNMGGLNAVAWHPKTELLCTTGDSGQLQVLDLSDLTGSPAPQMSSATNNGADFICNLSWSPDGSFVAVPGARHVLWVWNITSGSRSALTAHEAHVNGSTWSPDGKRLASASEDGTTRVFDIATNRAIRELRGHEAGVRACMWSPDGRFLLTAGADATARLWEVESGEECSVLRGHTAPLTSVSWSSDGRYAVTASLDGTVKIWDVYQANEMETLALNQAAVFCAAWHPDGRQIAIAGLDGSVQVWDVIQHISNTSFANHDGRINAIAWSPDGQQLLIAGDDGTMKIYNSATGQVLQTLTGHAGWVTGAAWHPDGRTVASVSFDGTARIWDVQRGDIRSTTRVALTWTTNTTWLFTTPIATDAITRPADVSTFDLLALAQARVTRVPNKQEIDSYLSDSTRGSL